MMLLSFEPREASLLEKKRGKLVQPSEEYTRLSHVGDVKSFIGQCIATYVDISVPAVVFENKNSSRFETFVQPLNSSRVLFIVYLLKRCATHTLPSTQLASGCTATSARPLHHAIPSR